MKSVGLTGGIGSGKSTIARLFEEHGVHWVDADDVAREVVEPGTSALKAIAEHFGHQILQDDGALDRAALRAVVFQDDHERRWLEKLLHPIIRDELIKQLQPEDYDLPYTLLVSPLLLETDQHTLVDRVVVVDIPIEEQIARATLRDNNTEEQVRRIIKAQMPRDQRLKKADHVIDNSVSLDDARATVSALHTQLVDELQRTK
ncbi:dephospho-CoA kinase [Marinobacter sp. CHS3-4]|uniref:dephospho-CoA kinase n=1 Tax=Marinobacter sp. CHS3-4 TaxID=3045174 RepID=UPI0024B55145|nr:dephospho-CoA kinase [Marinobacter sp. CHS3-4]MDI9244959.1 dephospho-CoA kinase [Marinobacter sp. CHS3-4]